MEISRGKVKSAQKVVIYGPEGIGKSTFAAQFPNPIFIDTEGSTKHMDVARTPKPSAWSSLMEQVLYFVNHPEELRTLVIDTADWAEQLCITKVCTSAQKKGIEDFGYGKGYTYLAEEFARLLNLLEQLVGKDVHVVLTAHAKMRKFEQPDEMGAYDRWEMKLQKNTAPLVKEWADMVLFANYKTFVVKTEDNRNKAQGGKRVLYTAHSPCWDAKNRHNLSDEIPFEFASIAHCIDDFSPETTTKSDNSSRPKNVSELFEAEDEPSPQMILSDDIPRELAALMEANNVEPKDVQQVVGARGYYPADTPIGKYDKDFVKEVLVAAWPQVLEMILASQDEPF